MQTENIQIIDVTLYREFPRLRQVWRDVKCKITALPKNGQHDLSKCHKKVPTVHMLHMWSTWRRVYSMRNDLYSCLFIEKDDKRYIIKSELPQPDATAPAVKLYKINLRNGKLVCWHALHRALWNWLSRPENACKGKESWPGWHYNGGNVPSITALCFACGVSRKQKDYVGIAGAHHCQYCPLVWPGICEEDCYFSKSLFQFWQHCDDRQERAAIAHDIATLPLNQWAQADELTASLGMPLNLLGKYEAI